MEMMHVRPETSCTPPEPCAMDGLHHLSHPLEGPLRDRALLPPSDTNSKTGPGLTFSFDEKNPAWVLRREVRVPAL